MGLIDARATAKLERCIGCFKPDESGHEAFDEHKAVREEAREVARAVVLAVKALRGLRLSQPGKPPRPN